MRGLLIMLKGQANNLTGQKLPNIVFQTKK